MRCAQAKTGPRETAPIARLPRVQYGVFSVNASHDQMIRGPPKRGGYLSGREVQGYTWPRSFPEMT